MSYPKRSPNPDAKQNAVSDIQSFLSQLPASKRKKVMAVAGEKSITPEGLLREVEEETHFGLQIIDIHNEALKLDVELFELHLQECFSPLVNALKKAESLLTGKPESSAEDMETALGENSKNLLLIHPDSSSVNDTYISEFVAPAASDVYDTAIGNGWNVVPLPGSDATKENINKALQDNSIDLVLHYDHGNTSALFGWNKEPVIDSTNASLLSGKCVSSVSCFPAFPTGIGQIITSSGAKAFLGYDSFHIYDENFSDCFINSANAANKALLEGKTILEAYMTELQVYRTELDTISKSNSDFEYAGYVFLTSDSWAFKKLS